LSNYGKSLAGGAGKDMTGRRVREEVAKSKRYII